MSINSEKPLTSINSPLTIFFVVLYHSALANNLSGHLLMRNGINHRRHYHLTKNSPKLKKFTKLTIVNGNDFHLYNMYHPDL